MTDIDTNVANYTLSELLTITGIENEEVTEDEIMRKTDKLINQFKQKNPQLSVFFKGVRSQLLQYAAGLEYQSDDDLGEIVVTTDDDKMVEGFGNMSNEAIYPLGEKQVSDWYENENLTQTDQNQVNKITQRKQKIGVFGNDHVPMKRQQIATTDTFRLPVKQDSLNPNLKNTVSRFVNLDSQFRQYTSGIDSMSTDYTVDLSDTLKNALKLTLYSYQIPFSWYAIDSAYGNTCFWLVNEGEKPVAITVPSGNYSQLDFEAQLNQSFLDAGFHFPARPKPPLPVDTPVKYNRNSGIISLFLLDGSANPVIDNSIPPVNFSITDKTAIVFYDFTGVLQCNQSCTNSTNHYFNNTLGWLGVSSQ